MTFAAEWPTATHSIDTGVDAIDDLAPDLSEWADAVVEEHSVATDPNFSLTVLVRQWMNASEALERLGRSEGDDSPLRPTWTPPVEDTDNPGRLALVPPPALPRRRRQPEPRLTRRLAVLIDAESTSAEWATSLFDALADEGTVSVCRAYGDWTAPKTRAWWSAPLRQHAIQPHHHFGEAHDQRAQVALTIDAVDLARESAVDVVVLVGDLTSLHPLVVRLNATGVQVIAFGTTSTPHDVRALCYSFVDATPQGDLGAASSGRHRA